ncbi:MAG: signal recognition particle protein [Gemmatimonadetes bacterium]|nr:signal recognition particle protein [Gemmatimonadota bacterium]MYC14141.1 signal recognition particle protein [Gemmatimonadota bacterium]MYK50134.1 signal recognition particle protein [Gemmatimonadota bacterium]
MFEMLTERLNGVFKQLRSRGRLSEANIDDAMREVRRALLEADVNYKVARSFIARIKERAIGQEVLKSITPGQQVVKVVHDELIALMGNQNAALQFAESPPSAIMMVGLQGSGKTTASAKLARLLASENKKPLLVAADIYRPAAIDQLCVLAEQVGVPVHRAPEGTDPVDICTQAMDRAKNENRDVVILDTAGRLHVDDERMDEVFRIREAVSPSEILFVCDAMTGQDAVSSASAFYEKLNFSGVVLTRMDSDTRGGAALSIREVAGVPIKYIGVSEKVDGLEVFHPDRMASRILGMGDVVTLVEKAQASIDDEQAKKVEQKLRSASFTFDDFLEQMAQIRQMGPLDQLMKMIPGVSKSMPDLQVDEKAFTHIEAIIYSMTPAERDKPHIINGSRRKRIANGSGRSIQDVNKLLKQFNMMQKMMKRMSRMEKQGKMAIPMFG